MKYLLLSLLLLSTATFAQSFDANLLVGKWQCQGDFHYKLSDYKGTAYEWLDFNPDGTYKVKMKLDFTLKNEKDIHKIIWKGKWNIDEENLNINIEKLLRFSSQNKEIERQYRIEESLKNRTQLQNYKDFKILELSSERFVYSISDEVAEKRQATSVSYCKRIHKK